MYEPEDDEPGSAHNDEGSANFDEGTANEEERRMKEDDAGLDVEREEGQADEDLWEEAMTDTDLDSSDAGDLYREEKKHRFNEYGELVEVENEDEEEGSAHNDEGSAFMDNLEENASDGNQVKRKNYRAPPVPEHLRVDRSGYTKEDFIEKHRQNLGSIPTNKGTQKDSMRPVTNYDELQGHTKRDRKVDSRQHDNMEYRKKRLDEDAPN